jgi:hypothetical protein
MGPRTYIPLCPSSVQEFLTIQPNFKKRLNKTTRKGIFKREENEAGFLQLASASGFPGETSQQIFRRAILRGLFF